MAAYIWDGTLVPGYCSAYQPFIHTGLSTAFASHLSATIPFLKNTSPSDLRYCLALLFGLLLLANESNIILRTVIHALDLEPPNKGNESTNNTSTDIDHKEYNAGLIIAAKGLARMKQIEQDKQFAEYVLVGTFLSTLMAVVIAYWVKSFL